MGLHLVSGTFVGAVAGWFLDKWLGTNPWLFLTMLVLGIVAGFMNVYRDAKHLMENEKREQGEHGGHDPKP